MSKTTFLSDVVAGLSLSPKQLSSKYFYDDQGSQIFQEIMAMPEYYLTRCEYEILTEQALDIAEELGFGGPFQVIELGAGDGEKTLQLLRRWNADGLPFQYLPIDVSGAAIADLLANIAAMKLDIAVLPQIGDYFECLEKLEGSAPKLFLFLGANIGNYGEAQCLALLRQIRKAMAADDLLMIGFDLQKEAAVVRSAYDDPHGITKRFNMNLLHRINRELDGNFIPAQFDFQCTYDTNTGELKSYLISQQAQSVFIAAAGQTFSFDEGESIHTELSKKYTLTEIESLAQAAGFVVKKHFTDKATYFVDSLWATV
jgi:L-histidine Nalpha-methyltransferase